MIPYRCEVIPQLFEKVTNAVFLGSPPPAGYGFSQYAIAGAYATPMIVLPSKQSFICLTRVIHTDRGHLGELIGHFVNDAIMYGTTRRNHGAFEAESRLWQV